MKITRLAEMRKRKQMTQAELASHALCHAPWISMLESKSLKGVLQRAAYALAYEGDPMELLDLVEEDG